MQWEMPTNDELSRDTYALQLRMMRNWMSWLEMLAFLKAVWFLTLIQFSCQSVQNESPMSSKLQNWSFTGSCGLITSFIFVYFSIVKALQESKLAAKKAKSEPKPKKEAAKPKKAKKEVAEEVSEDAEASSKEELSSD